MYYYNDKPSKKTAQKTGTIWDKNLFTARSVLIFGEINMDLAKAVTGQLLALAHESIEPIKVIINSPGGHVESGDTIHDMLQFIDCKVNVIGTGWVASAGALIYLGVPKAQRYALPNTRFLLHQPSGGMYGQASDVEIQAREIIKMKERLNKIIADETGVTIEKVASDTNRDYWLSASEAKDYGIVGSIIHTVTDLS